MPNFNAILDKARKQQEAGYRMPLNATFAGLADEGLTDDEIAEIRFDLRMRRISMNDPSWVEGVPRGLREDINKALTLFDQAQKKAKQQGNRTPEKLEDRFKDNPVVIRAANAFCVAVALEPTLYLHENDEHDADDVWVEKLDVDDRLDIFMACLNDESDGFKKMKVWLRGAEPAARSGATGAVAAEPVRLAGANGGGVVADPALAVRPNGGPVLERVSGDRG